MTVEQGTAEADVRIRTPIRDWMWMFVFGLFWFALAAFEMTSDMSWSAQHLVVGSVFVGQALWIRTFGVDLTAESAHIRGLRQRSIPWQQVQAVLRHQQPGSRRVTLILESGQRVNLRAPATFFGLGGAEYERELNRIGHWWLEHRGETWRPVRPEAPRLPVQG